MLGERKPVCQLDQLQRFIKIDVDAAQDHFYGLLVSRVGKLLQRAQAAGVDAADRRKIQDEFAALALDPARSLLKRSTRVLFVNAQKHSYGRHTHRLYTVWSSGFSAGFPVPRPW